MTEYNANPCVTFFITSEEQLITTKQITVYCCLLSFMHLPPCFAETPHLRQIRNGLNIVEAPEPIKSISARKSLSIDTTWQLQLQGELNTLYPVDLYDVDLFDTPRKTITDLKTLGKIVICYFSAGSFEEWRPDANQYSSQSKGLSLDGWPGERWLDIRTTNVRQNIVLRLNLAQQKGCDGVDPDNVDGYTHNTGFDLTSADQLAFNRFISGQAHNLDMLIGLKNDVDQIPALVDQFDFAVNEQCHEFNECQKPMLFIKEGKPVFNVEYGKNFVNNPELWKTLCYKALSANFQTLVLPLGLDDSFRLSCRVNPQIHSLH